MTFYLSRTRGAKRRDKCVPVSAFLKTSEGFPFKYKTKKINQLG